MHSDIQVVALGIRRADMLRIGIALDPFLASADALCRAVAALPALGGRTVQLHKHGIVNVPTERALYLAYFPALPGCNTWGTTYEAAVKNAAEALALYVETLSENGDAIPQESTHKPISLGVTVRTSIIV